MRNIILGAITVSMLVSCGKKSSSKSDSTSWTVTNLSKNPILLTKQDKYCTGVLSYNEVPKYNLRRFMLGIFLEEEISFENQIRFNYIESEDLPIKRVAYEDDTRIVAEFVYSSEEESYLVKEGTNPEISNSYFAPRVEVCPETKSYKENSYEAAALNISNSITKTYESIMAVDPFMKLEPIEVSVAPVKYKDLKFHGGPINKQHIVGYETDNAYYHPEDKEITFLPQSKDNANKLPEAPLWEIPMVGAHEYGHHVFQHLVAGDIESSDFKHSSGCFKRQHHYQNDKYQVQGSYRDNGMQFALRSINEGFADLIAFYALNKKEGSLKGVKCFTQNREVQSSSFASGDRKAFDIQSIKLINSETPEKADQKCETPNFQEIHDVGAIFAHTADQLLGLRTRTDRSTKLKILLKWATMFKREYSALKDLPAGEVLFAATELMYKVGMKEIMGDIDDPTSRCREVISAFNYAYTSCRYLK